MCGWPGVAAWRLPRLAGWPEKYRNTPWDVYADASVCERGGPDIVVDGILGTGFSGSLRPLELGLVGRINALAQRAFIFSLDIPSGLSGLTGVRAPLPCAPTPP